MTSTPHCCSCSVSVLRLVGKSQPTTLVYTKHGRTSALILFAIIIPRSFTTIGKPPHSSLLRSPQALRLAPHTSPLHSEPEPAPTTADGSSEATPSDKIDVEAEIADMVGMIRTALSSDPQDVEGAVSSVNEVIKAVRNAVGISNYTIWERLTAQEQAAYIRAINSQSPPEDER